MHLKILNDRQKKRRVTGPWRFLSNLQHVTLREDVILLLLTFTNWCVCEGRKEGRGEGGIRRGIPSRVKYVLVLIFSIGMEKDLSSYLFINVSLVYQLFVSLIFFVKNI